jgi:Protein of unknown function (DUF3060)
MTRTAASCGAVCVVLPPVAAAPAAHALPNATNPGDIMITNVNGSNNIVAVTDSCYAVTLQGSYNTVIVDTVINGIQVYGFNQTALYKNGGPFVWDRGRDLGMTNRIDRVPA